MAYRLLELFSIFFGAEEARYREPLTHLLEIAGGGDFLCGRFQLQAPQICFGLGCCSQQSENVRYGLLAEQRQEYERRILQLVDELTDGDAYL